MAKFQIALKSQLVEQKRLGLEKMLSAIFRRPVTLVKLITELGLAKQDIEMLELRALGRIAEGMVDYIEQSLGATEGGIRRYAIIERYFGLDGYLPARLSAMAAKYGISRERVRQLKDRALYHWRNPRQIAYLGQALRLQCYRHASFNFAPPGQTSSTSQIVIEDNLGPLSVPEWKQLSAEQKVAFDKVYAMKGGIITGCAGSGKTTVAMELAKKLAFEGKKVLLTCFGRALADFMQEELRNHPQITVASFHALCLRYARATKVSVPGGWNQRSFLDKFPELLHQATARDARLRFDAVIVDDAQEFYSNWWNALKSCLVPGSSEMYSFLDDNQLLCNMKLQRAAHLSFSFRSKGNLALLLREFYVSQNKMTIVEEENRYSLLPEFYLCQNEDEVKATASYIISNWVFEKNIKASDIVVLTPRLLKFSKIYQRRLKNGLRLVTRKSRVENHIWINRIGNIKGLERKAVLLLDLDDKFSLMTDQDRALLPYLGVSRAVENLCIIGNSETWNFINSDVARRLGFYGVPEELVSTVGDTTGIYESQRIN